MNGNRHTTCDQDTLLEDFVAELTRAAYAVALWHGGGHLWLDLELDLWRVLTDTVQRWRRQSVRTKIASCEDLGEAGDMEMILAKIRGLGGTVLKTNVDVERARLIRSTLAAAQPGGGEAAVPKSP